MIKTRPQSDDVFELTRREIRIVVVGTMVATLGCLGLGALIAHFCAVMGA